MRGRNLLDFAWETARNGCTDGHSSSKSPTDRQTTESAERTNEHTAVSKTTDWSCMECGRARARGETPGPLDARSPTKGARARSAQPGAYQNEFLALLVAVR